MKKLLLLASSILLSGVFTAQTVVTIGVGTTTSTTGNYNPIYRSSATSGFDFSRAYYLFDQAELTAAGIPSGATITKIEWDKTSTGATVASTAAVVFNILMKNSGATTYSAASTWGTLSTGATAVYGTTAQVIPATTGFLPFNLSTSFIYTGGALEVLTDWNISAVPGNPTTGAFTFNSSLVSNKVGGTSASTALTGTSSMATQVNRPNIRITYTPPAPCSGLPTAGTVVASNTLLCVPQNVNLSLSGSTSASGLTYQWLSSPDGTTFSPIPTATNIATTQSVAGTTYFQCAVACGTAVATSNTIIVNFGTTPNGGTTVSSSTLACVGQSVSINLTGASSTPGLTYQWQSSPNGSSWTSIPTGTTSTLTQTITGVTYYQAILGCASNTATSTPAQINLVGANVYATVPFLETFDNAWQNRCDNQNVPTTSFWSSNPTTGNGSWRRQDAGATAAWSFLPTGIVTPMGAGAANFHSYGATANTKGDLDLYIDMNSTTANYELSFYNFNISGNDTIQVWLSTNNGSSFVKKGQYLTAGVWTKQIITLGSVGSPTCVVRFRGISDYGNDDMGIDSLKIYTAICTTPPVAGVITGTNSTTVGSVNSYSIAPSSGNLQWYSSTSVSGPWNPIPGATSATPTITAVGSGTVYYGVIATSPGCPADTTNTPFAVNIIFPGDNVCAAIPLPLGVSTTSYSINGSSTQTGEVVPPATGFNTNTGWGNNTLSNTLWFTFVAPASGYVTVQSPDFDTQLAIWKAASCSDLLSASTATLIAANDDDANYVANAGVQYSSLVRAACLTPGATYFIQLDSYDAPALTGSTTRVLVTDMGTALNASFTGLAANYCLPASSSSLTPAVVGGVFTINTSTASVTSFTPTTIGTNTVMYSIYGCKTTSTTIVANKPNVTAVSSNSAVCSGSSATLTAGGATNYTWTAGGTTSTEVVTPSSISVYTVTGETSGCTKTATVSVGVIANPTVTAMSSNTSICSGASATLTAGGATNYTWTAGGTASTEVVTPSSLSVYTVTGETSGCTKTATVSVGVIANPTVTAVASSASVCAGSSATLTAGGATNYTWTAGGNTSTEVVTPSSASIYTVTGETNGCMDIAAVSVGVNQTPVVSAAASQTLLCDDGSTGSSILTASSTATSFMWSNGANTMTTSVTPTTSTVYMVTATELGCSANAFVTVTVSNCNGIKELVANGISIYPNPTNGVVTISISSELAGSASVEVYDAIGKLVIKDTLSDDTNTINLSKLQDGMYMFKIINNDKAIKVGKVVKQ